MQETELPKNWVLATNDDLGDFINGFAFKPADRTEHGTPIIRIQNLTDPQRPFNYTTKEVDQKYVVEHGDILVSWSATLDTFRWDGPQAYVNQHIFKVVPSSQLNHRFVFFALKETINELTKSEHLHGTTMKHVNRKPFLAHPVGLPPLNEQHRIVEKIETLFAHIDKGEEALREVQKLLKRYRQSILKAAVTGELTRDWRKANPHKLEPASDLLDRILETRRENWQGRGKYKEPTQPKVTSGIPLPEGWVWASVDHLLRESLSNGRSVRSSQSGFPVLTLTALKNGQIDLTERKIGDWTHSDAEPFCIREGDVLVSRGNGSKHLVGRGALVREKPDPVAFPDTMIRIPLNLTCSNPHWFIHLWNSPFMRGQIESCAKTTAGIYKINQGDIRSFEVPLPPLPEQREISAKIDDLVTQVSNLEAVCEEEMARSSSLRQSILKSAFTGQLVPQEPNDEPASELLARIRAEREATPKAKPRRKARA